MHCHRNRQAPPPAGERGTTPGLEATGDGRCMGARTIRAWLRDYRCERRTGNRTKPSIRPCGSGRRRGGLASHPSDRGGIPPVEIAGADRARSRCPSAVTALTACEHRPSTRRGERSANRLRTRCGRAYNRYGLFCQGCAEASEFAQLLPPNLTESIASRNSSRVRNLYILTIAL